MRNTAIAALCVLLAAATLPAQRGAGDWMTGSYDPQRSSWVRSDGKISRQAAPGMALVWKVQFDNPSRQLNALTPPALLDFYIGYRGFRALGFFGGSSDRVVAVDTDLGRIEWQKDFSSGGAAPGTPGCPGGMTSTVSRPTTTAYPTAFASRGAGRGTPAKSGVGSPDEGAVTIRPQMAPRPPARRPPPAGADPFSPRVLTVLALTGDGRLHSLWVSNGNEPNPSVPFIPANAYATGLIEYGGTAYAATSHGCGGADNGVWALDLKTNKVTNWKTAAVAGTAGPAVRPDGSLFVSGGRELTALAQHTLEPIAKYDTGGAVFTSSPLIFEFKGKDLVAAATNDGRLHLLSAELKGALDKSPPFSAPDFATGALASWQDPAGTRWIMAPAGGNAALQAGFHASNGAVTNGAIVAFRVAEKEGGAKLEPGWVSRDMISPLAPIVVNGVVFALASGEYRGEPQLGVADRALRSKSAVLYALDPFTGKELWNSGRSISGFVHSGGLAAGGGRVYVSTYDSTQFAFGFPMEH